MASLPVGAVAEPELVLQDDTRLVATTSSGTVSVLAGPGLERTYEWNGCSFASHMEPRGSRWYGSLGIHGGEPGAGVLGSLLPRLFTCKGIDRTLVEEAQIHFPEQAAAERWIARYAKNFETVWSNDGVVVQWIVSPARRQLGVSIWQVCVAGRRPTELSGAKDGSLQFSRVAGSGPVRHDCASVDAQVLSDTQRIWQEHWRQADHWNSPSRQR